jgi:hypothetical protein
MAVESETEEEKGGGGAKKSLSSERQSSECEKLMSGNELSAEIGNDVRCRQQLSSPTGGHKVQFAEAAPPVWDDEYEPEFPFIDGGRDDDDEAGENDDSSTAPNSPHHMGSGAGGSRPGRNRHQNRRRRPRNISDTRDGYNAYIS